LRRRDWPGPVRGRKPSLPSARLRCGSGVGDVDTDHRRPTLPSNAPFRSPEANASGRKPTMSHPRSGEGRYPPLLAPFRASRYGLARFFLGFVGLSLLPSAVSGADESLSLRGHTKRVSGLAYSPDGGNDGKLFLWDLKGDRRTAFPDEHGEVLAVAFGP